jgi:hypothetical protein
MAENDPHETEATTLGGLFVDMAREIESQVARHGWDQPASLWEVVPADADALVEIPEHLHAVAFTVRPCADLSGHPYDAMVGLRIGDDAVGAVVVTEGWTYSTERGDTSPTHPPSHYEDSRELRIAHIVLRDGTEATVMRARGIDRQGRGDGHDTIDVFAPGSDSRFGGRIVWAARRTVGVPSRAGEDTELPSLRDAWKRRVLMVVVASAGIDEHVVMRIVDAASSVLAAEALPSWEEERIALLDRAADSAGTELHDMLALLAGATVASLPGENLRALEWIDGEILASDIDDSLPRLEVLRARLWLCVLDGSVSSHVAERCAELTGIETPEGGWAQPPHPRRTCPCGSGRQYRICHGRG